MTTGITCPGCGGGVTQPGEPCRGCKERDMNAVARIIARVFLGKPIKTDADQKQRMP
jgi:hypothetical protein